MLLKKKNAENLLEMYPHKNVQWSKNEDTDLIVLQAPRFGVSILNKVVAARLKKPTFDVKLDKFGSFFWNCCDGSKNIQQIADELQNEFDEDANDIYKRASTFVQLLRRERYITIHRADGSNL